MKNRLAEIISNILNPFMVSFVVIILLSFETTRDASEAIKWASISVVLSVLPVFIAILYLVRVKKLDGIFVNPRRQRNKIYLLASIWAVISSVVLILSGAPRLLAATFVAGLAAIIAFMVINRWWKISLHTAFVAASVTVLSIVYFPVGAWVIVLLLLVAWARLEMKLHSPAQVVCGAVLSSAIVCIVFRCFGLV